MPDSLDPRSDDPDRRPLDELFIVGAKYHEPTAAERAEAAKRSDKERKKADAAREKEIAHTRKVLGLDGHSGRSSSGPTIGAYDKRNSLIAFSGLLIAALLLSFTAFAG